MFGPILHMTLTYPAIVIKEHKPQQHTNELSCSLKVLSELIAQLNNVCILHWKKNCKKDGNYFHLTFLEI